MITVLNINIPNNSAPVFMCINDVICNLRIKYHDVWLLMASDVQSGIFLHKYFRLKLYMRENNRNILYIITNFQVGYKTNRLRNVENKHYFVYSIHNIHIGYKGKTEGSSSLYFYIFRVCFHLFKWIT